MGLLPWGDVREWSAVQARARTGFRIVLWKPLFLPPAAPVPPTRDWSAEPWEAHDDPEAARGALPGRRGPLRVLYASDNSEGSREAGRLIARWNVSEGDEIHIVAVTPLAKDQEAQAMIAAGRQSVTGTRAAVSDEVLAGSPAEQILEAARRGGYDLIVLGAMGSSAIADFFLGSVSERVVRHASCDVLLARPPRWDFRRAMIGIDGRDSGAELCAAARALPLPPGIEYHLITVVAQEEALFSVEPLVWTSLAGELTQIVEEAVKAREEDLRALAPAFSAAGMDVRAETARGDAATALLAAADQKEIDLLFVGSHQKEGMERFLLGSVSDRVARHARASVYVARLRRGGEAAR